MVEVYDFIRASLLLLAGMEENKMSICHYFFCVCVFCSLEKSLSILASGLSSLVGAQMVGNCTDFPE